MKKYLRRVGSLVIACAMLLTMFPAVKHEVHAASSGSYTPVGNVKVDVSGASNVGESNGIITVNAKGSGGLFGIGASAKTATITITNTSTQTASVSFDWTAENVNQLTINGAVYGGTSGNYNEVLAGGASFKVVITTAKNSTENVLKMLNFAWSEVSGSSKVTFTYDAALGSVTANNSAVSNNGVLDVPATGVTLVATAKSGATFYGWVNKSTGTLLSASASFLLKPAGDMTVQAIFSNSASRAIYKVGDNVYDDLNAANNAASASSSNKTIVLIASGLLPAGDYQISAGVTLLIPCDGNGTVYTTVPNQTTDTTMPTAYRNLVMASGAKLTVYGSVSVAGTQSGKQTYNGCVVGPVGFITMQTNSSIVLENGSYLYAWGYITGSGAVEAKSGSTVYESFQLTDFRGGQASGSIQNGVFPMSQYYVQNIEVPLTIHAGAEEYAYMSASLTLVGMQGCAVPVVSDSDGKAMFKLSEGYLVKDFEESTGRLSFTLCGTVSVSSISASISIYRVDSAGKRLPIPGHVTVDALAGSSVNLDQDLALLPGSELYIREGATCTVGEGVEIYAYALADWAGYTSMNNLPYVELHYAPGRTGNANRNKDAMVVVDGVIDASLGSVFTTSGKANIYSTGTGQIIAKPNTSITVIYEATQVDTNLSYVEVAVIPASIKNADGTLVSTADYPETSVYQYANGVWMVQCMPEAHQYDSVVTAPTCTEDGYTTYTCTVCGASYIADVVTAGHTEVIDEGLAATCTTPGYTEGKHCSVCNEVIVEQVIIDALGHTWANATCTVSKTCSVCNATEGGALGHTWIDATCTAPKTCSVCNETEGEALGHTWGVADCDTAKTCTVCGATEGEALGHIWVDADCDTAKTCSACGATEGEALGHTWVEADCDTAKTCSVCGATEGDALGHTWAEATCTAPKTCSVCNETEGEALGHTWGAADCDTAKTCSVCGATEGDALGHAWVEADCDTAKTCSICGATDGDALGHTEVTDAAVEATCTKEGLTEGKHCSVCGEILIEQKVIAATGHTIVMDKPVDPTCTESGLTEGKHCSVCNEVLLEQQIVNPLWHSYVVSTKVEPSCTETGLKLYVCSRCEYDYTEVIPALKHNIVYEAIQEPTCTEEGESAGSYCTRCDYVNGYSEIPALGHDYQNPVVVTEPTCTVSGSQRFACTRCVATYTEEIPATGHAHDAYGFDADYHWSLCHCGEQFDHAQHAYVGETCVCGAVRPADIINLGGENSSYTTDGQNITVDALYASTVICKVDDTYLVLEATVNADGSYTFVIPEGADEITIAIIGDMDCDGKLDSEDMDVLSDYLVTGDASELSEVQLMLLDTNGNGKVNSADKTLLARALLDPDHPMYKALEW